MQLLSHIQPQDTCLSCSRSSWGQAEMSLWTLSSEKGHRAFFTQAVWQAPGNKEGERKEAAAIMFINKSHY